MEMSAADMGDGDMAPLMDKKEDDPNFEENVEFDPDSCTGNYEGTCA